MGQDESRILRSACIVYLEETVTFSRCRMSNVSFFSFSTTTIEALFMNSTFLPSLPDCKQISHQVLITTIISHSVSSNTVVILVVAVVKKC